MLQYSIEIFSCLESSMATMVEAVLNAMIEFQESQ